ncbi:MAG: SpoIVB peptidase, partial [Clostridium sp.]
LEVSFLGLIEVKSIAVQKINDLEVYPGGSSIGIRLSTEGVLVVGHSDVEVEGEKVVSPAKSAGVEIGDVVLKINGENIQSSSDLSQKIIGLKSEKIDVELLRDEKTVSKEIVLLKEKNQYKLGLWVRDSSAGIGTLTFYHKETGYFGALGHPITDGDTNKAFSIKQGQLLNSSVLSVKKGEKGNPGELKGLFVNDKINIGEVNKNTKAGVFGRTDNNLNNELYNKPIKVGFRNEIKEGAAKIITTIDEQGPREYDIEIIKLLSQDIPGPKSMVIKVIDKELLEKTGGIVQGMSGSPIIQNKKIVGAVTHVLINKPDVGYGIYIEWMLKDAGVIE